MVPSQPRAMTMPIVMGCQVGWLRLERPKADKACTMLYAWSTGHTTEGHLIVGTFSTVLTIGVAAVACTVASCPTACCDQRRSKGMCNGLGHSCGDSSNGHVGLTTRG